MKQYIIKINENELNNLKVFLDRVDLKGSKEALEFVKVLQILANAEEGEE